MFSCAGVVNELQVCSRRSDSTFFHGIRHSNGTWNGFNDGSQIPNARGDNDMVACAGVGNELHVCLRKHDGRIFHAIRNPNGTWNGFSDASTVPNAGSNNSVVACAGVGNELHVCLRKHDGRIFHAIRNPNGTWNGFNDASTVPNAGSNNSVVACAGVGNELHVCLRKHDGRIFHAIRKPNGTWNGFNDASAVPNAGSNNSMVACAGVSNDLHVCLRKNDGRLFHAIRKPDGTWNGFNDASGILNAGSIESLSCGGVGDQLHVCLGKANDAFFHAIRNREGSWNGFNDGTSLFTTERSFPVSECTFNWTARYSRTANSVVVRIRLIPNSNITPAQLSTLMTTWQNGIRNKWSNTFGCASGTPNLAFDVQWVNANEHHAVTVRQGPARSNMTLWDDQDNGDTAAHEYGHMLGMRDEYVDASCPSRNPVGTGTVMDRTTGPVVQRYIDAVCRGVPGEPFFLECQVDPRRKTMTVDKIQAAELASPVTFTLVVSGGAPGERLEYSISVDEQTEQTSFALTDELKNVTIKPTTSRCSRDVISTLKEILKQGALPTGAFVSDSIVPGSVVGTLAAEVGTKRQVVRFPVEDTERDSFGTLPEVVLKGDSVTKGEVNAVQEAMRILIDEAKRLTQD